MMSIRLDMPNLLRLLKEAASVECRLSPQSEECIRQSLSDGAYYLWRHVLGPLHDGNGVESSDIDFDAFTLEDVQELLDYFYEHLDGNSRVLCQFSRIFSPFDLAQARPSPVAFV